MENKKNRLAYENDQIKDIQPPNILIKMSSASKLHLLSQKDRGVIFTNIYHFHMGEKLLDMTPVAKMFFIDLVEVFDYNKEKYKDIVQRNQANGRKNKGRSGKSQINPLGSNGLPDETKDIAINKEIDIDIAKDELIYRDEANVNSNLSSNANFKTIKDNYKAIYNFDFKALSELQDKYFCFDVIALVDKLGWDKFYFLVLSKNKNQVPALLQEYGYPELKDTAEKVIRNSNFYFTKLLK